MAKKKSRQEKTVDAPSLPRGEENPIQSRARALVFVSHDSRDADIAEAFANLLSDVSAGTLKSFRSSDKKGTTGIEFGAEWYKSIMSQLGDATDVVALLTPRSIDRPWILYEAGVAKGKLDTTVLGLALGVPLDKVSTGPFGQFQNCGDDEDSLTKLVIQLLQRNPDAEPREEAVRMQVKAFISSLTSILAAKPKKLSSESTNEEQGVAKLFEEIKAMVRELPQQLEAKAGNGSRRSQNKFFRKFHPKYLEELAFQASSKSDDYAKPAVLLIFLSVIKEDVPWVYEAGMGIYRSMLANDRDGVMKAHHHFQVTCEMVGRTFLVREISRDEEAFLLSRYLPDLVDMMVHQYLASTKGLKHLKDIG